MLENILKPKTFDEIQDGLSRLSANEKLSQCAANNYRSGVIEALFAGADINFGLEGDETPLEQATMAGHYGMSKFLIQQGAWICDNSLMYAIGNRELFCLMLNELHAELCTRQDLSETIQAAVENGHLDLIILIEQKIDEKRLLTVADREYFQRMILMADDITLR